MFSDVLLGLRWNISLGAKFLRVVPSFTLTIVLLTLVSQVAMLLASVLPLKVIIMLGTEGVPNYFPGFISGVGRSAIIGFLSGGTVGFFILHLVCERMIGVATGRATKKLLAKSQKIVLFEGQNELAASSYQRYSRALAGGVFTCTAIVWLSLFYPVMALLMLGYFLFVLFLLWQGVKRSIEISEWVANKLAQLMNVLALVGFFWVFAYLVCDFLFLNPPTVIVALIAFLLIRQAMQRAASMVTDLTLLYRQKAKLNSLFFHGQVFQPVVDSKQSLWPLLTPNSSQEWIAGVLNAVTGKDSSEKIGMYWHQLGNPYLVGVRAVRAEQQFLLKLYEPNRSALALHEADLMAEMSAQLPAPSWLGSLPVNKLHCLVYQLPMGERPTLVGTYPQTLRTALLSAIPRPEVVQRYMRSKAVLWQRLNQEMLERLEVAITTADQKQSLALLLSKLPLLKQLLEALPLAVFNAEISQDTLWLKTFEEDGAIDPILLNWGNWSLEPIGVGWPEAEVHLSRLSEALVTAAGKRPELIQVKVEQVQLAALGSAFEREYSRQRYLQALDLIPRILDRMNLLESARAVKRGNAR